MAANKQRGGGTTLTRELESIRDSLAVPTQIPLLEDVVDHSKGSASAPTLPGKSANQIRSKKTQSLKAANPAVKQDNQESTNKLASSQSELKLNKASLEKLKSESDKIIEDLISEYSIRIAAYLRKELSGQLNTVLGNVLKDLSSGAGSPATGKSNKKPKGRG